MRKQYRSLAVSAAAFLSAGIAFFIGAPPVTASAREADCVPVSAVCATYEIKPAETGADAHADAFLVTDSAWLDSALLETYAHNGVIYVTDSETDYYGNSLWGSNNPDRLKFVLDERGDENSRQTVVLKYADKLFTINMSEYMNVRASGFGDSLRFFESRFEGVQSPGTRENASGGFKELLHLVAVEQGFGHMQAVRYVFDGLYEACEAWLRTFVDKPAKDAVLTFRPSKKDKFLIIPHEEGRSTDRDALYFDLYRAVIDGRNAEINVSAVVVKPSVLASELQKQTFLRSRFSTQMASSSEDRKHNIGLALSKWNGKTVEPGETVSFNELVGPRTPERGFRVSKMILDGKFVEGLGGGVCQSSTTLYNAALLADMYINSANRHSLSISYVEPSFDAMVSMGSSDLEFTNIGDTPVYVRTWCSSSTACVEFYGTKLPYTIKRKSVTTKRTPPPPDEVKVDKQHEHKDLVWYDDEEAYETAPKDAIESKGYLQYLNSKGKVIKEVLIRRDQYAPQRGVLVKGTEPRPVVIPEPEPDPFGIFGGRRGDNRGGWPFPGFPW